MTGCYNPQSSFLADLGDMDFRLTNEQFDWLIFDSDFGSNNLDLLRRHFVDGASLKDLAAEADFKSPARIYSLVKKFNRFLDKKLMQHGLEITVVINDRNDRERILHFDIASKDGKA